MEQIQSLLREKDLDRLKELLASIDPIEISHVLQGMRGRDKAVVFRLLDKENALEVFEQMEVGMQRDLIASFTDERANEFIADLDPDDRVRLLDELPAKVAKRLLASLSPEERTITNGLMGYAPGTAGRIMTPHYFTLQREITVAQALEKVRGSVLEDEALYTLYITDNGRRLDGTLPLTLLARSDPSQAIGEIMQKPVVSVSTEVDQEEVAHLLQERDLLAVPVLDREERLVGIITVDDAMDILEQEATEDLFEKAGLVSFNERESGRSERLLSGTIPQVWRIRLPFLIITLAGGLLAGAVIGVFEEVLDSVTAIAIFIPVIMDMGGNVGTQSSTIFTRALVLGQIDPTRFMGQWIREVKIGLSMGVMVGLVTGIIAWLWQGIPQLGLAVGIALLMTVTLATSLGFLVPYILTRLGLDQAAGADPIITTIKDVTGLIIYFVAVSQLLQHLL